MSIFLSFFSAHLLMIFKRFAMFSPRFFALSYLYMKMDFAPEQKLAPTFTRRHLFHLFFFAAIRTSNITIMGSYLI